MFNQTEMKKIGQMPIRRGKNALVTLSRSYFMFHGIASYCETWTLWNLLECSITKRIASTNWKEACKDSQWEGLNFGEPVSMSLSY